jgi:hypothetical protein
MPSGPKLIAPALWLNCGWAIFISTRVLAGLTTDAALRGAGTRHCLITLWWLGATPGGMVEKSAGPCAGSDV